MLLPVCPNSPHSLANMMWGWFICFVFTWDSHHVTATATNRAMTKGAATTTSTTHLPQHLIGVFFFWPFICFYIFTKQLYSFRLHYYTWPPPLMQTWHGVDFVCFICTQNSHHITVTATNRVMTKPPPQLEPQPLISTTTSHVIGMFFFFAFYIFFYTEQLYSFRLCYYTWPSPLACKCDAGLVDQIVQTCHLFLDFHRSVLLCIE